MPQDVFLIFLAFPLSIFQPVLLCVAAVLSSFLFSSFSPFGLTWTWKANPSESGISADRGEWDVSSNLLALFSSILMVELGTNVGTFTSLDDTVSAKEFSAFRPLWRANSETIFLWLSFRSWWWFCACPVLHVDFLWNDWRSRCWLRWRRWRARRSRSTSSPLTRSRGSRRELRRRKGSRRRSRDSSSLESRSVIIRVANYDTSFIVTLFLS